MMYRTCPYPALPNMAIGYGACSSSVMLFKTQNTTGRKPGIHLWWILLLVLIIAGTTYLVIRDDPGSQPPVPSPNFNSGNEGLP